MFLNPVKIISIFPIVIKISVFRNKSTRMLCELRCIDYHKMKIGGVAYKIKLDYNFMGCFV